MTTQEKLNIVEATIRKVLPRLMEPTEGVILKRKETSELYSDYVILKIKREDYSTYVEIDGKHNGSFSINNEELLDCFEIIGHDITVLDVLEWLGHERKNELYTYSLVDLSNNILKVHLVTQISDVEHYAHEEIWESIEIDLTKPRLADQSGETINILYNLINFEE